MDEGLTVPLDMRVGWRKKSIAVYRHKFRGVRNTVVIGVCQLAVMLATTVAV